MSSRKKHITAELKIIVPNKMAHLPPGDYEVAMKRTWIEDGCIKIEAIVIREVKRDEPTTT